MLETIAAILFQSVDVLYQAAKLGSMSPELVRNQGLRRDTLQSRSTLISALGTPLDADSGLHTVSFGVHFEQQTAHGIDGVLVAGSMGAMQMLRDETYLKVVRESVALTNGRIELLVGIGDASYGRTLDRLKGIECLEIDGVVVLPPYMATYSQRELQDYFTLLADESRVPLFLYDLPQLSRNKLDAPTVRALAKHPNIAGIKCSDDFSTIEPLLDLQGQDFRVIVARPRQLTDLLGRGVSQHLDGIFALAPRWSAQLRDSADRGDMAEANHYQLLIDSLLDVLISSPYSVHAVFSALMNIAGFAGNFAPEPFRPMAEKDRQVLIHQPLVIRWADDHRIGPSVPDRGETQNNLGTGLTRAAKLDIGQE